jgi:hypothetical protein
MRGLGMLPWSVHGSNNDLVIALYCAMYPNYKHMVECASTVMDYPIDRIADEVADQVVQGNTFPNANIFERGMQYIRSTMPNGRVVESLEAERRIARYGIRIPRVLRYVEYPSSLLRDSIKANRSLITLAENVRLSNAQGAYRRMVARTKRIDMEASFPVMLNLRWYGTQQLVGEKMPDVLGYADARSRLIYRCVGIYVSPVKNRVRPRDIVSMLRDQHMPGNRSEAAILSLISQPRLGGDETRIADALVAIGAEPSRAMKAAVEIKANFSALSLRKAATAYSIKGTFEVGLDSELSNLDRLCKIAPTDVRPHDILIREVSLLLWISEVMRTGETRKLVIDTPADALVAIHKQFGPKNVSDAFLRFASVRKDFVKPPPKEEFKFMSMEDLFPSVEPDN